jgi:tetratricopeptide (TPR) repeat protein
MGRKFAAVFANSILVIALALPLAAKASGPEFGHVDNVEYCYDKTRTPDARISACINVLESGVLSRQARIDTFQNLGGVYLVKGDYAHAKLWLDAAIKYDSRMWQAYFNRSTLELKTNDLTHAAADIDQAAELAPEENSILAKVCWVNGIANTGLDTALNACNKFLEKTVGDADALNSRALVYYRTGDYPRSIADNDAVIAKKPRLPDAFYMRGMAKLKSGDVSGGNADIVAAKAIDPTIANTYAGYGVTP